MSATAPASAVQGRLESGRVVRFALRLGVALLASGAQTTEVEQTIRSITRGLGLPPFFQTLVGVTATALVVVMLAAFDLPIDGGLVLSGSLLRFLPGNALVSGMRDLIDGSTISGTAGLAEALLLGGAVAGGAGAALAIGADLGVTLSLSTDGRMAWPAVVLIGAAAVAVAFYAIQLGVPRWALPRSIALGALAATVARGWVPGLPEGLVIVAAFLVGILARVIARRTRAPAALWAVPAILPLLPGLAIVSAMLEETSALRIAGLFEALVTGFAIGIGVGMGDVVMDTARRVRVGIVDPAVAAVTDGLGALVVTPSARRAAASEQPPSTADGSGADARPVP